MAPLQATEDWRVCQTDRPLELSVVLIDGTIVHWPTMDCTGLGWAQSAVLTTHRLNEFFVSHEYTEKARPKIIRIPLLGGQMRISGLLPPSLGLAWCFLSIYAQAAWAQGQAGTASGFPTELLIGHSYPLGFQEGED